MNKETYDEKLLLFRTYIDSCFSVTNNIPALVEKDRLNKTINHKERIILLDFFNRQTISISTLWRIFKADPLLEFKYPKTVFENGIEIKDFLSAFVLVRTLFENYVNMHYLLCDSIIDNEKELRILFWERYSLTEREPLQKRGIAQLLPQSSESELNEIDSKIRENLHYQKLMYGKKNTEDVLKVVQKDRWSLVSIHKKAERAGIEEEKSKLFYKILSDYAHSGPLSIDISNLVKNASIAREEMFLAIKLAEIFSSLTINMFSEKWGGEMKELINKEPFLIKVIKESREKLDKGFDKII